MMPSIKEQLSKKIEKIEQTIDFYLPEEKGLQKTVLSAMNYSVKAGGKRLRPMLMAETYEMFGGADSSVIEPFMAAIASPNFICAVGIPLRNASLSSAGRSSCINEYV